jgi:hypothetical protein
VFSPKSKSVPIIFIEVVEFDIKKNSSASLPDEEMSLENKNYMFQVKISIAGW